MFLVKSMWGSYQKRIAENVFFFGGEGEEIRSTEEEIVSPVNMLDEALPEKFERYAIPLPRLMLHL